ncbi:hypothetical protein CSB89_2736 [Pseudomonas aeruginosa]|nr:hypothetical protein CSB89_2736 [Pseudomonas aeruginosa]
MACLCIRHPVHSPCRARGRASQGLSDKSLSLCGRNCWASVGGSTHSPAPPEPRAPSPEPRRANSAPALSASAPVPRPADSRKRLFALPEHPH